MEEKPYLLTEEDRDAIALAIRKLRHACKQDGGHDITVVRSPTGRRFIVELAHANAVPEINNYPPPLEASG